MNLIAIIILCTIGVDFILNLAADGLNLKHLRSELPHAFEGVYDPERYRKSQHYLKVNTEFGWITSVFNLCLILVFWFAGGFPLLDKWVRAFELGPVLSGLIYIGVLVLLKAVLSLPFSIYAGHTAAGRRSGIFSIRRPPCMVVLLGRCDALYAGRSVYRPHMDYDAV